MLFDIDGTFFVHLVWFLLLMVLLNGWLFAPYFDLRERRRAATQVRIETARQLLDEVRFLESKLQEELEAHRQQASQKRQEARREFQRQADAMRQEADRQAEEELAAAETQLQFEAEKVRSKLEQQIPEYIRSLKARVLRDA